MSGKDITPCPAVQGLHKYIYVHDHEERFYDLAEDPEESRNQVGNPKHRKTIALLEAELFDRFKPASVAQDALTSQRIRRFIYDCAMSPAAR